MSDKKTLKGYSFYNERGKQCKVIALSTYWCMIKETDIYKPYVLPRKFVETIKNESKTKP